MTKKKVYSIGVFASIALFFSIIALVLSFLPLRMFAIIPAVIAIYFTIIAYILSKVFKRQKKYVLTVFAMAVLSIGIAITTEAVTTNEVEEDKQFDEKLKASTENIDSALLEAFEEEIPIDTTTIKDSTKQQKVVKEIEEEFTKESFDEEVEF